MQALTHPTVAIDEVVAELLSRADVAGPPVDGFLVASRLGVRTVLDDGLAGRARTKRLPGGAVVVLRPDERAERLQWALAHELGELHAWRVYRLAGRDADELGEEDRERIANEFAARLLLPTAWFADRVAACDRSLPNLKETFGTASHELIAVRLLDLPEPCVVTVFDNGRLVRRRSNRGVVPLQPFERDCWRRGHESGRAEESTDDEARVRCWPIHEPEWRREIVVTTGCGDG